MGRFRTWSHGFRSSQNVANKSLGRMTNRTPRRGPAGVYMEMEPDSQHPRKGVLVDEDHHRVYVSCVYLGRADPRDLRTHRYSVAVAEPWLMLSGRHLRNGTATAGSQALVTAGTCSYSVRNLAGSNRRLCLSQATGCGPVMHCARFSVRVLV